MSVSEQTPLSRGETLRLEQRAKLSGFLGLSLKNGLLNILTLTLYRFWGKTEVRRRIWSSTYLNGEPFEYTGRGKDLFFGFLIALAVLGLPYLVIVFAVQMAGPMIAGLVILPLYVFLIFLVGFGLFTAFRYMASRTVWRGVRFRLRGSPSDYGLRLLVYSVLAGVTLGWFAPAMRRKMAKHLWRNLSFGDQDFRFDEDAARKVNVYGPFALAWGSGLLFYLVFFAVAFGAAASAQARGGEPPDEVLVGIGAMVMLALPILVVLMAPYQAAILRSIVAGIVFQEARFRLRLTWPAMFGMTVSNLILIIVSLGFLTPFVQARAAKFLIDRIDSEGAVDLSRVRQTEVGPKTAEGLADAFGIAPI